ncbi:FkbM family methyltransferase [Spirosoma sp. HMF3257]|uniref:Methyltransferase FkbM domain-containing protein n=1 Tax=Spirosoma telluris TaxID=2183553 RepID=A0A327NIQ1_9BACT|nr:FkbM family methyltransferase [Spirosoma telluris]RAI74725.1 hypothetical protein HMF3257_11460 [Spirosoma telluris]
MNIKRILSLILKKVYQGTICAKPFYGTNSKLYYEKGQHLIFLFKKSITYEPIIQRKLIKYIKPGDLVFDIGGNIGQYALLFSKLVGTNGSVITFEPDSKNYSFLQFNIEINNLKNVTCLKVGLSDVSSFTEFYRDTETGGRRGSFNVNFVGENYQGHKENVETKTLDLLINKFGEPSFIKIDVEGFEEQVIRGLTLKLKNTTFLIEVRSETKTYIFDYFNNIGYQCYYVDKPEDLLITDSMQIPDFANLIFLKAF